jgi:lipoprotein-releasing system ATP-binding protein
MLLHLNNISKGYGIPGSAAWRPVLVNLHLKVEKGTAIGIVGPSGSGKTTLLNMAGALDRPDAGQVLFGDQDISHFTDQELARFRNRQIGFVFQQHHLLPQCTLLENVLLPVLPSKKKVTSADVSWAEHLLKKTGIWEQRKQKPGEMSGGECQRAAVVRAVINKPALVFGDEPTGALDETNSANLTDLLLALSQEEGITLVLVTHSTELATQLDLVYHLHNGILTL